jgi:hypothetical protein
VNISIRKFDSPRLPAYASGWPNVTVSIFMFENTRVLIFILSTTNLKRKFSRVPICCDHPKPAALLKPLSGTFGRLEFWTTVHGVPTYFHFILIFFTVELSRTKLETLPPLVLGGIIENQNSDFVTP